MVYVSRKKGDSIDNMFRRFTRSFIDEDIVTEVRKRQFYKKPSLVRKEEEKERLKRGHNKPRTRPMRFNRTFQSGR